MSRLLHVAATRDSLCASVTEMSLGWALVRTARPKQWSKNVLVLAGPGSAGVLVRSGDLERVAATFLVFCALASGTYFFNDAIDAPYDRRHPVKMHRPVAAGQLPILVASLVGVILIVGGVGASTLLGGQMLVVCASYVVVQFAYLLWLKHVPVVELGCVAAGFVLRAVAGGVAVAMPISKLFLIVAMLGALSVVTAKRLAEFQQLGDQRGAHRRTLDAYSEMFLHVVTRVAAAGAVLAYFFWALEKQSHFEGQANALFVQVSIVPFMAAILRYQYRVETGHGGEPEEIVLHDRTLQTIGLAWLALFAIGVYTS